MRRIAWYATVSVTLLLLSAPALAAEIVKLTAWNYSRGDGPANLVSNAIPFKPGQLFRASDVRVLDGRREVPIAARVLATWPQDGAIRSLLIQFSASFKRSRKSYTLVIRSPRTTPDRDLVPVTWELPRRIITLPARYLSDSLVFWEQTPLGTSEFPAWERKQERNYHRIQSVGSAECARHDQYYDAITTSYQLYARTGELRYLVNARRWALHHRRDQIHLDGPRAGRPRCEKGHGEKSRYTFPQGLISDYFMFGDEEARRVSGLVVDRFYMPHVARWCYKAPGTSGFWTEREAAFALIGILAHYEATGEAAYLDRVRESVASLHRMQVENGRRAWVHDLHDHDPEEGCPRGEAGSSPWMSGLLLEAVIKYHKLTGDKRARESILMALNDLGARYLATGRHAGASFVYLGCSTYRDGTPELDNLIAHAFGYGYKLTGSLRYRTIGTAIFTTSVKHARIATPKEYNQQFRSSGHFVAYIKAR